MLLDVAERKHGQLILLPPKSIYRALTLGTVLQQPPTLTLKMNVQLNILLRVIKQVSAGSDSDFKALASSTWLP